MLAALERDFHVERDSGDDSGLKQCRKLIQLALASSFSSEAGSFESKVAQYANQDLEQNLADELEKTSAVEGWVDTSKMTLGEMIAQLAM